MSENGTRQPSYERNQGTKLVRDNAPSLESYYPPHTLKARLISDLMHHPTSRSSEAHKRLTTKNVEQNALMPNLVISADYLEWASVGTRCISIGRSLFLKVPWSRRCPKLLTCRCIGWSVRQFVIEESFIVPPRAESSLLSRTRSLY